MADEKPPIAPAPIDIAAWFQDEDYVAGAVRGGGPGLPIGPGAPGVITPTGGGTADIVLQPPTIVRPPRAQDFHISGASPIGTPFTLANTTPPAIIPGSALQIPNQSVGVIRSINLNVNTLLATSVLFWSLRFNQTPVQGWEALTVFPRAAGFFTLAYGPDETQIPVPDGALVDVTFSVLDGAAYQAGVQYGGWYYDRRLQEVFADAWRV